VSSGANMPFPGSYNSSSRKTDRRTRPAEWEDLSTAAALPLACSCKGWDDEGRRGDIPCGGEWFFYSKASQTGNLVRLKAEKIEFLPQQIHNDEIV
jgi:hypothetical protein